MNVNRGHETQDHRRMKRLLAYLFTLLGYLVLGESNLCDVLAFRFRHGCRWIVAGEAERQLTDHIIYNAQRDFERGADRVLLLVSDGLEKAVRGRLRRHLPRAVWTKIGVTTLAQVERTIQRLEGRNRFQHVSED